MTEHTDFQFKVEIDWPTKPSSDPWQCFGDEMVASYGKPGKLSDGRNWGWKISPSNSGRMIVCFKDEAMMMMWRIKASELIKNMTVLKNG